MLAAFAEAARVLERDDYLAIAEKNAAFVLAQMRTADGRMLRTWKGGHAKLNGYLEDYAHCRRRAARALPDDVRAALVPCRPRARRLRSLITSLTPPAGSSTPATTTRRCSCGPRESRTEPCLRAARWRRASCSARPVRRRGQVRRRRRSRAGGAAAADGARASGLRPLALGARLHARSATRARHRRRRAGRAARRGAGALPAEPGGGRRTIGR